MFKKGLKFTRWYKDIDFVITDIEWERIFLKFKVETKYKGDVQFALVKVYRQAEGEEAKEEFVGLKTFIPKVQIIERVDVGYESFDEGCYSFEINVANVDEGEFLDNGGWRLAAFIEGGLTFVNTTSDVAYAMEDMDKVYKYGRNKYAYNVTFSVNNIEDKKLEFIMYSYFLKKNDSWKTRNYVYEANTKLGKLKRARYSIIIFGINLVYKLLSNIFSKNGRRILFMSETKDAITGNLKYIDRRIKERGLDRKFKISYSFRKAVSDHQSVFSWVKLVVNVAKQDYIFVDDYSTVFGFLKLHKNTKLIQVWHAGEGFKSVGYSRFGKKMTPYPKGSSHKVNTNVLVGSKKLIKVYEEVFGVEREKILPVGMPRLDDFLNEEKIDEFKTKFYSEYPNLLNKKIILFAPTFRGGGQKNAYYNYARIDLRRIYDFCGNDKCFLIKMHPFVIKDVEIPKEYADRIFNFRDYPNINDLYYVTDVLITDYSSNYYEYALMKKPMLFYTYDREIYELTRGVHRSVKDNAPGKICDTFDELMYSLENEDYDFEKSVQFVEEQFRDYDGKASDRVIDQILMKGKSQNATEKI